MLWCGAALIHAGIATPLPYDQSQMWARGDDNEWFLTSRHELAYLTLREMAGDFLQDAAEDQDILRHTAHPTGAWDWEPPAAAFPEGAEELDLLADEAALEGDIVYPGSNHGSTGNDVARWLFYLMWLSLSYLILCSLSLSLSLSLLFNVACSLFYLLG